MFERKRIFRVFRNSLTFRLLASCFSSSSASSSKKHCARRGREFSTCASIPETFATVGWCEKWTKSNRWRISILLFQVPFGAGILLVLLKMQLLSSFYDLFIFLDFWLLQLPRSVQLAGAVLEKGAEGNPGAGKRANKSKRKAFHAQQIPAMSSVNLLLSHRNNSGQIKYGMLYLYINLILKYFWFNLYLAQLLCRNSFVFRSQRSICRKGTVIKINNTKLSKKHLQESLESALRAIPLLIGNWTN